MLGAHILGAVSTESARLAAGPEMFGGGMGNVFKILITSLVTVLLFSGATQIFLFFSLSCFLNLWLLNSNSVLAANCNIGGGRGFHVNLLKCSVNVSSPKALKFRADLARLLSSGN